MNVQDRRRLLGPANAKPIVFTKPSKHATTKKTYCSISNMYIKTGLIKNCNGSSYLELVLEDGSKFLLITSVYGPKPIRGSFVSKAAVSVHINSDTNEIATTGNILSNDFDVMFQNDEETLKDLSGYLKNCFDSTIQLEKYPKSGIDIFVNVVSSSNLQVSTPFFLKQSINGILSALIDANIEVSDLIGSGVSNNNCITTFIKNGQEIVGFWKMDDDEAEDYAASVAEVVEVCKQDYFANKKVLLQFLEQE